MEKGAPNEAKHNAVDGLETLIACEPQEAVDAAAARSREFLVVGVGASAGGLEALEGFFEHMPPDCGLAFVVVQHLSPDFKSLMDELLSRRTALPIHRVEDGMEVEPNAIYLIPPKKEMIVSGGRLLLTDKDPASGLSLPIDTFLRSLAQDAGDRSVAVILSGTGTDGSRGVRAVHEAGGLVLVQSEQSAKFDGMPRSAIETGMADFVLPPGEMADVLTQYAEDRLLGNANRALVERLADTGLNAIFAMLRTECGLDFSHYRPNTVLRRIERRLQLNQSMDLEDYVAQLRGDPRELNLLYKDLLIGVTRFFRDAKLFDRLKEEVLPEILEKVPADQEIRAWVAGCATGEEAYSLAILFHELLTEAGRPPHAKIFATDVHSASLESASGGVYDDAALADVSAERLERYFAATSSGRQVSPDLRKMIVFAPHNVIKDAPFTRLDLISCRNLLIYLKPQAQQKALSLFHFGLKTRGVLVLGPSESPGELLDEFETLDPHWKIYRKRREARLASDVRVALAPPTSPQAVAASYRTPGPSAPDPNLVKAYDALMAAYVPPSLLVNAQRELLHTFSGAGKFLRIQDGRPTSDALDMLAPDLRLAVSSALQRSMKNGVPVAFGGLAALQPPGEGGDGERLRVQVRPVEVRGAQETYYLISFEPDPRAAPSALAAERLDLNAASRAQLVDLEEELRYTKENLQAIVEEIETTNEELQATNEELVASNEELQSTNEELHSVNEELYTVNAEYQRKIAELTELTDDMDNLLRSTDVGTIFLDRDLQIRKFTPKTARVFQLLPQDVGRRLDNFSHNILREDLVGDVRRVLETETPFECDVQDRFGEWYLLRILPYRTNVRVEGAVLTLISISRLKETEMKLRRLSKVFMDGTDPIVIEDLSGRILDLNAEAERAYGWSREELLGQSIYLLVPPESEESSRALREECRAGRSVRSIESVRRNRWGEVSPILLTLSPLLDDSGRPSAIATIAKDITAQKKAEREAVEAARRRDQFLAMLSHELRNPLGALLNATRLFRRASDDPEVARRTCEVVERQGKRMARLLDDLLDVARFTQGKIHLRKETVDLRSLAREAVQAVEPTFEESRHRLTVDLPAEPVYVEGDWARLLQVQENLLTNAAKYTPPEGEVLLRVDREGAEAVLVVRDEGIGVDPELHAKIFELFVQGPRPGGQFNSGMGIGLAMAKTLVELHGGRIAVHSEGAGRGSEFEVRLPLAPNPPADRRGPEPSSDRKARILVVEDNADSRELLASLLRLDGHDVSTAADGIEGFERILSDRPDVALVDVGLPRMDGYELARRLREALPEHPVQLVALTGFGRSSDREAVFQAGFHEHLVKPVDPDELARVLRVRR